VERLSHQSGVLGIGCANYQGGDKNSADDQRARSIRVQINRRPATHVVCAGCRAKLSGLLFVAPLPLPAVTLLCRSI
jgi:hypothetical protein